MGGKLEKSISASPWAGDVIAAVNPSVLSTRSSKSWHITGNISLSPVRPQPPLPISLEADHSEPPSDED